MRGTWQTTGGGGLDLAPVATALVAAVLVFGAVTWLAARAWWILGGVAVLAVLAGAGAVFAWRGMQRAKAGDLARIAVARRAVQAEMNPQVTRGTQPPAIENHFHVHHHYADSRPEGVRVIPGTAGDAITEGRE